MKITLKYSILRTPIPKTMSWYCLASSLPLFEDEVRWKSITDIESEYALIAYNNGYEVKKSDKFRELTNKVWEKCLLNKTEETFFYEIEC